MGLWMRRRGGRLSNVSRSLGNVWLRVGGKVDHDASMASVGKVRLKTKKSSNSLLPGKKTILNLQFYPPGFCGFYDSDLPLLF